MQLIATDNRQVVVGLGMTGLSCARYLARQNKSFSVVDSRELPPALEQFRAEFPDVRLTLGGISDHALEGAGVLIVSPGVALEEPAIARALAAGTTVCGDVDLFCAEAEAPIVAITGSNGKSTVTTLVGKMAEQAGLSVAVGGNIGVPALDLLSEENIDVYVLELSSFQLERADLIGAEVATVLNMSADHMDRYQNMQDYHRAKHRIFRGARKVVINRDDPLSKPLLAEGVEPVYFGVGQPDLKGFGVIEESGKRYLAFGLEKLMLTDQMKMFGDHNIENALASLALGHAIGLPLSAMLKTLQEFSGLSHRCQLVAAIDGIDYYNDSKGTNVGAANAAISGLSGRASKIVLIAGGETKGADLSQLLPVAKKYLRTVIAIGQAAEELEQVLAGHLPVLFAESMDEAVSLARNAAQDGDAVLLSPACASFDMFDNFQHRGEVFSDAVLAMLPPHHIDGEVH